MELLIGLAYFLLLTYLIQKWRFFDLKGIHTAFVPSVFALKIICGLMLTAIYSNYYDDRNTADIFKYYDDSLVLYNAAFHNFSDFLQMMSGIGNDNSYFDKNYYQHMNHWLRPFGNNYYNDTHILIRFNAFMRFLSFGYFSVHTIFFNFLSILGIVSFYKAFSELKSVNKKLLLYGICLLPSILLWGSGVLKEGMLLLGMGLLFYTLKNFKNNSTSRGSYMLLLVATYLLIRLKFYIVLAFLPGLISFYLVKKYQLKKVFWWHLTTLMLFLGLGMNLGTIIPRYDLISIISNKQKEFICLAEYMNSGSSISLPILNGTAVNFMKALPNGLFNGIFRPLPWNIHSLLSALSAIELLFINATVILSIIFMKRKKFIHTNLLMFCISVVVVLYTIIGISTPVVGALVRYKVPALLFIVLIISILIDTKKLGIFASYFNSNDE